MGEHTDKTFDMYIYDENGNAHTIKTLSPSETLVAEISEMPDDEDCLKFDRFEFEQMKFCGTIELSKRSARRFVRIIKKQKRQAYRQRAKAKKKLNGGMRI